MLVSASTVSLQLVTRHMTNPPTSSRKLDRVADSTVCMGEVMAAVSLDSRLVSSPVDTPSK